MSKKISDFRKGNVHFCGQIVKQIVDFLPGNVQKIDIGFFKDINTLLLSPI